MAITDPKLVDGYYKVPMVKTRNRNAFIGFSGYWGNFTYDPPPAAPPSDENIRYIIISGRIPTNVDNYVNQTMVYFLQDPGTGDNIRQLLSEYNPDTDETALGAGVRAVLDAFAPRWLQAEIPDSQVDQWLVDHGFVTQEEVRALRAERKAKLRGEGTDGERT